MTGSAIESHFNSTHNETIQLSRDVRFVRIKYIAKVEEQSNDN